MSYVSCVFSEPLSIEAKAALAYWSAWSTLTIQYPRADLSRVPEHWQIFGARVSALTGSPRLAVNPPNAVLNYLYSVLERTNERTKNVGAHQELPNSAWMNCPPHGTRFR